MSVGPARQLLNSSSVSAFTPGTGHEQQSNVSSYALAPYPLQNPPQLIGVDCVTQTITGTQTITFPNLPIRGTGLPLASTQNQPKTLTVNPGDLLMFEVSVQGSPVTTTISGIVLDNKNTPYSAPFIGPGTFKAFQAIVSAASPTKLTIWGKLYLQRGGGQ